jgi:hypothetical protein
MGDLDDIVAAFARSPWGRLGAESATAENRCKCVSLALLAVLRRHEVHARLWNMSDLRAPDWGNLYREHYVVEVCGEVLDFTARQWGCVRPVDFENPWDLKYIYHIRSDWMTLPDTPPC